MLGEWVGAIPGTRMQHDRQLQVSMPQVSNIGPLGVSQGANGANGYATLWQVMVGWMGTLPVKTCSTTVSRSRVHLRWDMIGGHLPVGWAAGRC
jgi:hypothetical protein